MDATVDGIIVGMTSDKYLVIETSTEPTKLVKVWADIQDLPDISELRGKNVEIEGFAHYTNGDIGFIANEVIVREEKDKDRFGEGTWPGTVYKHDAPVSTVAGREAQHN